MASWDGNFDFTVDDRSLLRAILIAEGAEEGWNFHRAGIKFPGASAIVNSVLDKAGFAIIKENEHLRALLRAFLQANICVADHRAMLASERERGFIGRWRRRAVIGSLEAGLPVLEAARDEAFKKYEMLRRLTDWENVLLKRIPA